MNSKPLTIPKKNYAAVIMGGGAFIALLGVVFGILGGFIRAFGPKSIYDLPVLVVCIGVIVICMGASQFVGASRSGGEVEFSGKNFSRFLTNNAIIISLLFLILIICFMEPRFLQVRVVMDILAQSSPRLIIALGISFTLLIAGCDLSAGRVAGTAAVIAASFLQNDDYSRKFWPEIQSINILIPIVLALVVCMLFGTLSGFLTARFDMHPFIATLAAQVIAYGACSLYYDKPPSSSQPLGGIRGDFTALAQTKLLTIGGFPGISILVPMALVVCVAIWFVMNKTVFGKNVYAIGGNREAAVVSGVNVFSTTMIIFILASATYAIGGMMEAARTAGATNNYCQGYEFDAISACVVGGVSLMGGIGKVSGIVTGVLIFTVIQYGLQFIGLHPMWQQIIKGVIIAVAVSIDMTKYRSK
jgi:methyl-galactoside transport system permease protein